MFNTMAEITLIFFINELIKISMRHLSHIRLMNSESTVSANRAQPFFLISSKIWNPMTVCLLRTYCKFKTKNILTKFLNDDSSYRFRRNKYITQDRPKWCHQNRCVSHVRIDVLLWHQSTSLPAALNLKCFVIIDSMILLIEIGLGIFLCLVSIDYGLSMCKWTKKRHANAHESPDD